MSGNTNDQLLKVSARQSDPNVPAIQLKMFGIFLFRLWPVDLYLSKRFEKFSQSWRRPLLGPSLLVESTHYRFHI